MQSQPWNSNHSWAQEHISDVYSIDLIARRRPAVWSRNIAIHIQSDHKWLHFTFDAFKIIDNKTPAQRHMQNQTNHAFIIRVFLHLLLYTVVWFQFSLVHFMVDLRSG